TPRLSCAAGWMLASSPDRRSTSMLTYSNARRSAASCSLSASRTGASAATFPCSPRQLGHFTLIHDVDRPRPVDATIVLRDDALQPASSALRQAAHTITDSGTT